MIDLSRRQPPPHRGQALAGEARLIGLLTRLPARLRERLVAGTLGLTCIKAS
ncbi:hypothetical protein HD597_000906 [Nonomuraea thailandensis]|uniref:Uncharacterized protein n=1 Tax=Nonomuraea thailandensis TaxID=1188745 RepID=A0A9X2G7V7_9ACTN|nr:hypothetical protein [Nonomuraea thailandensis]MCP2353886.1 hypothetical protein [Nonomuraea thailandensis]